MSLSSGPLSRSPRPLAASDPTTSSCASCPGRERNEWCALDRAEVSLLDAAKLRYRYRAGDPIFYQGNACGGLHCIEEGTVALRKRDGAGNAVIARLVHPNETLGARTLLAGGTYSATAVALTDARVCFIDKATVMGLLERSPALAKRFLRRLAEDLRGADDEKLEAASLTVRERLERLLVALSDRYGREGAGPEFVVELPLARQDMAALLGVRPESVTRAIRALERDGAARFDGRRVRIPDIGRLIAGTTSRP